MLCVCLAEINCVTVFYVCSAELICVCLAELICVLCMFSRVNHGSVFFSELNSCSVFACLVEFIWCRSDSKVLLRVLLYLLF